MQNNFRFWKNLKLVWLCPFHTNHCLKSWPRNVHLWESILTSERSVNINLKANGKFKHQSNICSEKKNVCVWVFCFVVTTFCCGLFKDDSISSLTTSQAIPLWFPSCFDSRFPIPLRLPWDPDSRLPIPKAIPSCFDSRSPIPLLDSNSTRVFCNTQHLAFPRNQRKAKHLKPSERQHLKQSDWKPQLFEEKKNINAKWKKHINCQVKKYQ